MSDKKFVIPNPVAVNQNPLQSLVNAQGQLTMQFMQMKEQIFGTFDIFIETLNDLVPGFRDTYESNIVKGTTMELYKAKYLVRREGNLDGTVAIGNEIKKHREKCERTDRMNALNEGVADFEVWVKEFEFELAEKEKEKEKGK